MKLLGRLRLDPRVIVGTAPLFPLVVFLLFAATRRWERRVAVCATVGVLTSFLLLGVLTGLSRAETFELNDFLMRSVALAMIAAFLMNVAADEERVRAETERLAAPPAMVVQQLDQLLCQLLGWSAAVTGARRAVLLWEESEEPWLHLGEWRPGDCRRVRESPESMTPLVAPELAEVSFLCRHAGDSDGVVLHASTTGVRRWRGAAVHPLLHARFSMGAALSLVFSREYVKGRLFLLDKPDMTTDDLTLGEIVAGHIAGRLNHFYLRQDLADAAVLKERLRMARDLHDGGFHVLAGVAMELERLLRMPKSELAGAKDRIREIRDSMVDGQRGMRELIDGLRLAPEPTSGLSLEARLKSLAERLERQWRVEIRYTITDCEDLPRAIVDEIYLMVHEALVNIGRHASATTASVSVTASGDRVKIVVTDDGRGFGFTGRYDHETLVARQIGPWTLKQRAASLGGGIAIESGSGRTVLEIQVPVRTARKGRR